MLVAPQLAILLTCTILSGLGRTRSEIVVSAVQPSVVDTDNFISYTESTNDILSGILKLGSAAELELIEANVLAFRVFRIVQLNTGTPLDKVVLVTAIARFFEEHTVAPPTIANTGFGAGSTTIGF
jgi:hypothetical protein